MCDSLASVAGQKRIWRDHRWSSWWCRALRSSHPCPCMSECEGDSRRPRPMSEEDIWYFEYGPEPAFEPSLAFNSCFVLSLQWFLMNVKFQCASLLVRTPRYVLERQAAFTLLWTLLSACPYRGVSRLQNLSHTALITRESRRDGQHDTRMLTQRCAFLQLRYRRHWIWL